MVCGTKVSLLFSFLSQFLKGTLHLYDSYLIIKLLYVLKQLKYYDLDTKNEIKFHDKLQYQVVSVDLYKCV